jgi:hypothetical protein
MEYRAKQALLDMKKWSNAFKQLLNNNFGSSIGAEWQPYWINCDTWKATPYAKTTDNGSGLLTPEQRTTPGWSGANQVPLKVSGTMATVTFQPIGQNMTCQLCYRAADGTPVYGSPVSNGPCSLRLDKVPSNGVVLAVICNTDYAYQGDTTRKAHYDYRLQLGAGMSAADVNTKWYNVNLPMATGEPWGNLNAPTQPDNGLTVSYDAHRSITVHYRVRYAGVASIGLFTPSGMSVGRLSSGYKQPGQYAERIETPIAGISNGTYIVRLETNNVSSFDKITHVK